jgi:hypothetical protein
VAVVDPVSLIVGALAAGASAGVRESASGAVRDSYQMLKRAVADRFAGHRRAETALAELETDPDISRVSLGEAVVRTGASADPVVVEAAKRLMQLLDVDGRRSVRGTVDVRGAQGVQLGNQNRQINVFDSRPYRSDSAPADDR